MANSVARTVRFFSIALFLVAVIAGASACSRDADPEQVRDSIQGLGDPQGDILFALKAIEADIDACMAAAGFPLWEPGTARVAESARLELQLPEFELASGTAAGYVTRDYTDRFLIGGTGAESEAAQPAASISEPDPLIPGQDPNSPEAALALLGPGGNFVAYTVPGRGEVGRHMGGCQGSGYRSVVTEDDLPDFLAGESLLLNLSSTVRSEAVKRSASTSTWSRCMARSGLEVASPFAIGSSDVPMAEYAAVDQSCRSEAQLDESYAEALDSALKTVSNDAAPALEAFEEVSRRARLRLGG